MTLPIAAILNELHEQFPAARVVIQAPPGAGKSTHLPLSLLANTSAGTMVMLQPRRLAAVNIARFLAEQLGESVGETVGYAIRGETRRSAKTRLMIITEGVLVRWLQNDPELTDVDTVIFDEFHERNLSSDLALALLIETLQLRPQLSLLLMSATLPAEPIQQWLSDALEEPVTVLQSDGRQYPLAVEYRAAKAQWWLNDLVEVVLEASNEAEQGILVFVPGVGEINKLMELLKARCQLPIFPLHGQLPLTEQKQALASTHIQRIILATNVAETSVTIDGIDTVVDSGRERVSLYRPQYSANQLVTRYISMASATQRAGRAGRLGPGKVYRLWGESDQHGFADYAAADIATQNLLQLTAEVSLWGSKAMDMAWLTPPSDANLAHAQGVLVALGITTEQGQLTELGRRVMAFGSDVRLARIALAVAAEQAATREAIARVLATFEEPAKSIDKQELIECADAHYRQRNRLNRWLQRYQFWRQQLALATADTTAAYTDLDHWLLFGFPERVACQVSNDKIKLSTGAQLNLAESQKAAQWMLCMDVHIGANAQANRGQMIVPTKIETLVQHPALDCTETVLVEVSGKTAQRVKQRTIGQLLLSAELMAGAPTREEVHAGLVLWLQKAGLEALNWTDEAQHYWYRLHYFWQHKFWRHKFSRDQSSQQSSKKAAIWQYPSCTPEPTQLLQHLNEWAVPFWTDISSVAELKRWNPLMALKQLLVYDQQHILAHECPQYWQAPSGRQVRIDYPSIRDSQQGVTPRVAIKLQEAFGEPDTPTILNGQQPLTLDLLSPAGRLLQRTEKLASFWQNAYPDVKKEMRGRYPKHPWPDDPIASQATMKTKRQLR